VNVNVVAVVLVGVISFALPSNTVQAVTDFPSSGYAVIVIDVPGAIMQYSLAEAYEEPVVGLKDKS
jgi:hypothetical protein